MASLSDLSTIRDNYVAALLADSENPKPNYDIDGKEVDRNTYRMNLQKLILDLQKMINQLTPFIVTTQHRV